MQLLQAEQVRSERPAAEKSVPTGPVTLPLVWGEMEIMSPQENLSTRQLPGSLTVMDTSSGEGGGGSTALTVSSTERVVLPLPLVVLVKTTVSE